jgi:hypothetical protein
MNDSGTLVTIADAFNTSIVNSLSTLAIAVAMATFFYGGFRYIWGIRNGEEKALKDGNKFLLWGGIALFVMVSVYGIISVLQGTVGFSSTAIRIPNASLNFIGSEGLNSQTGTNGAATNRSTITGPIATAKKAAGGTAAPKAKDASGVCEPDADGTTYHSDPKNSASCLPDSDCQPGFKEDPSDKTQCVQMSNDEACEPEDGVTFTLQSDGTCKPNNGGCPPGEHASNGMCEDDSTTDESTNDGGTQEDGYTSPTEQDVLDSGTYNNDTSDGGASDTGSDAAGLPVDDN